MEPEAIPFCDNALCDSHMVAFEGKSVLRIIRDGHREVLERYSYFARLPDGQLDLRKMLGLCGTCRAAVNLWLTFNAGYGGRETEI